MELKPSYKQTEVGVIPEDWVVSSVGERGQVVAGKALAVNAQGKQRPYLRTKNVFDGNIDIEDVLSMPMTDEQFAQFQLRHGDVLLNEGQSLELVGRCSIYKGEYPEPCAIQNALLRFRAKTGTSASFASHLFRHCQQTGIFAKIALQTTSVAHLGSSRFAKLKLAWPPENEQQLIAAALDELDALLKSQEAAITKKTALKQAAMQELLTGKRRLPGFEGEWEVKRLDEVATLSKGDQLHSSEAEEGGKFAHLNGGITPSGYTNKSNTPANSIAISEGGNSCGYVQFMTEPYWCGGHCYSVYPKGIDKVFLYHALKGQQTAIMGLRVGSGLPNVQKASLLLFKLRFPGTVPEQTAIASVLTEMDAELTALDQWREKSRAIKQALMQELLTGRTRLV